MSKTYKITVVGSVLAQSLCPPDVVSAAFPAFDGWPVRLEKDACYVEAPDNAQPENLEPFIKTEQITN